MAFAVPFVVVANQQQIADGLSAHISSQWRLPPRSVPSHIKNYNWIDFVLSLYEAYEAECDTSILKNHLGDITEGPGFNIFAVIGKILCTPGYNVLEGITRRSVLEICNEMGLPTDVRALSEGDLLAANEVFACSTAGGVMPITRIDRTIIGGGRPGAVTMRLREQYWRKRDSGWYSTPVAAIA